MRRNMKILHLAATAGVSLALLSAVVHAADPTPPAGEQPAAAAVPAPVPATRPGADAPAPTPPAATESAAANRSGWNAEVATPGGGLMLNDAQTEVVRKVNGYFNALGDLKGNFVQTTADNKRMKGKFMVKRPGRFRFDRKTSCIGDRTKTRTAA